MTCPCDQRAFPLPLTIHAGLDDIPRALGQFPDWRLALLDAIGRQPALRHWRARSEHDFGVMLVEMAAYLLDVVSFYDALVCNDSYLATSRLPGTQEKLVSLLGYVPRPALASQVWLAAVAGGKRLVSLPAQTAFRSGAFDGHPPQVFELEKQVSLDPRINELTVQRVANDAISAATLDTLLVAPNSLRVKSGSAIVLAFGQTLEAAYVDTIQTVSLRSRRPATQIEFAAPVDVPAGARYSTLRIFTLGNTTSLWQASSPFSGSNVLLDGRAPIRAGDTVLFEKTGSLEVRQITSAAPSLQTLLPAVTTTVTDANSNVTAEMSGADIQVYVTQLDIGTSLGWAGSDRDKIKLHYGASDAASVLVPESDELQQAGPFNVPTYIDEARIPVQHLLLEDVHQNGIFTNGSLDLASHSASVDASPDWDKTLTAPVTLFGNVLKASRGQSVLNETLGTGDGSQPWQTFQLKQKPLTYLPAQNTDGFVSTLSVYVGGIRWQRVDSFFGVASDARVYTVRHDEAGNTFIRFGGGARLPSGAVVTANYRYGAGAAVPPAGSITQLARPEPGLKSVKNVLPAFGGGDAESADDIRYYAPRSALLLGRAISLVDLEAAARAVSGVEAVKGVFRWDSQRYGKRAVIYFIGDAQLTATILSSLQDMSEPGAVIAVKHAESERAILSLDVEIDSRYHPNDVIEAVRDVLYRKPEAGDPCGLLQRARLGPEGVIYNSRIVQAVMAVEGVIAVKSLLLNGAAITGYGVAPTAEHYFDFGESGTASSGITINGVS